MFRYFNNPKEYKREAQQITTHIQQVQPISLQKGKNISVYQEILTGAAK